MFCGWTILSGTYKKKTRPVPEMFNSTVVTGADCKHLPVATEETKIEAERPSPTIVQSVLL